ncbi:pentapeptide repeat-containing protein, partial [Mycobacterium marinum]
FFVTSDNQGQIAINLSVTTPHIPIDVQSIVPVNQVYTLGGNTIQVSEAGSVFPRTYYLGGLFFLGPINLGASTLTIPTVTIALGGPSTNIPISIVGAVESRTITFLDIPAAPGFGNTTAGPSSGVFNAGTGGNSGFANFGAASSGLWNSGVAAAGNSGVQNFGSLASGWANLGNTLSGFYNTSTANLAAPANLSGLFNVGTDLAGVLRDANGTILNLGLADLGHLNVGSGNVGDFNVGSANIGSANFGFGNVGSDNLGSGNIGSGNIGFGNAGARLTDAFNNIGFG